jgi:hypothetical protein
LPVERPLSGGKAVVGQGSPAHSLIEVIGGKGFDHANLSDFALIGVLLPASEPVGSVAEYGDPDAPVATLSIPAGRM